MKGWDKGGGAIRSNSRNASSSLDLLGRVHAAMGCSIG